MKIYLDTNIILDFFLNRAKAINGMWRFHDPKKLEFLMGILGRVEFATSFLTKAEVIRELVCNRRLEKGLAVAMWEELSAMLKWEYIGSFCFDDRLVDFVGGFRIKLRTLMNYQHLFIAFSRDIYFVTGDKDLLEDVREKKVYDKAMSYLELRRAFSSWP